jgi:brefeldin A-resistance guanine nucleotide exchange factor 1
VALPVLARYGDSLSSGWRNIMDLVMRLHRLGLLPVTVAALEGEDPQAAAARLPRLTAQRNMASTPSLLSRAFSRCAQDALTYRFQVRLRSY